MNPQLLNIYNFFIIIIIIIIVIIIIIIEMKCF